jgi:putative oxygen-independent coproporphyrinogen III oxidase
MIPYAPLALYIHWPFCVSKCPYCDFNSHVRSAIDEKAWEKALLNDMRHEAERDGSFEITSIFFGGGTPSLMPPHIVAALIEEAARLWTVSPGCEITLEANPSSVEAARFADLAAAGVNRVSLGLQSFDNEELRFLGRAHGATEGLASLEVAQSVFDSVNFDLIYALPGQSEAEWSLILDRAIALGTDHLSLYQLTIEPGTRFETLVREGQFQPSDADQAAALYELTQSQMAAAGLPAYEISNHARPGQESRHNLTYWRYGDYAGIGPGAHGRRRGAATLRRRKPENWLDAVARNGHGIESETALSSQESAREALIMGLRLAEGVDLRAIEERFGVKDAINDNRLKKLCEEGLVAKANGRITLTRAGMLLLDAILVELVAI